ncbi:sulfite exporter TauE/SafE family protein [Fontimonas sp. SYSU GA230001]|uniref:sulfite exporter TauE/SafE family protein n=1 Tax=Fontimonas sp. SYSU GA230001 TaxID=3142450 RepID=UPI0032B5605E
MEQLLIFLVTGACAGVLAGLFGVGGGLIMVPALAFVLPLQGVPATVYMQVAVGTSLAVISATSISSTLAHHRRDGVHWSVFARFAPGLAAGAVAGAFVADQLSGGALKRIVGIGAVLVALQMVLRRERSAVHAYHAAPAAPELLCVGAVIGLLSAIVGIGGGSLTVPYLSHRGLSMPRAVGTAAASGVPIAWAGASGFVLAGWNTDGVPAPHLGYVSLSAFATLAIASVACAPLGARLAHAASPRTLRRAFALLLTLVGLRMLAG